MRVFFSLPQIWLNPKVFIILKVSTLWVFFRGLFLFTNFDSHLLSLATWNFNFLFDGQRVFGIWGLYLCIWSYSPSSFEDFREKQCHATFTKFRCLHCEWAWPKESNNNEIPNFPDLLHPEIQKIELCAAIAHIFCALDKFAFIASK